MSAQTPCVIYAAKSTQDRHGSIDTQLDDCREMAAEQGWIVVGEYHDEGFSAYSGNRGPGLRDARSHAARAAAETEGTCMLVAQHSDRFSRGGGDKPGAAEALIEIWHAERRANVHLRSVEDDFDLQTSAAVANIGERNRSDSERKSKAVKKGHKRRVADRKMHHGGRRPYGYRFKTREEGGKGELVVAPHEAEVVRRIYAEYLAGSRMRQIANGLTADGLLTERNLRWRQTTVGDVLANRTYIGKVSASDGEEFDGDHEAIIAVDEFNRVATLRASRARVSTGGAGRPSSGRHLFLNGLLVCGHCGYKMGTRTIRHKGKPTPTGERYICRGRDEFGTHTCPQTPIPRTVIDTAVFAYFEEIGLDVEATRASLTSAFDRSVSEVRALREQADRQVSTKRAAIDRADADYESGEMSAANHERLTAKWSEELVGAEAQAKQLADREATLASHGPLADAEEAFVSYLDGLRAEISAAVSEGTDLAAVRAALDTLFEAFYVRRLDVAEPTNWLPGERELVQANQHDYAADPDEQADTVRTEGWEVIPIPRAEVLDGVDGKWRPVLRRQALSTAGENAAIALT